MMITTIKLIAETLGVDDTWRGECPSCGRRNTFTVTRTSAGVVFNCYSAHCDLRGGTGGSGRSEGVHKSDHGKAAPPRRIIWDQKIERITDTHRQLLADRVGFTPVHIAASRVGWNERSRRFVFPIVGATSERRGYVLRSFVEGTFPKTLTVVDDGADLSASWYGEGNTAVVVEDIPSAVRVSLYYRSIALNGVHVPALLVEEMLENGIQSVIWALDGDALRESCRYHRNYGPLFQSSRIMVLRKDFKNQTESELVETLGI